MNPTDLDKKKYCTLYLVRHGQTVWNLEKRFQGHKDSPLTKEGEDQARTLGKKLNHIDFAAVFSSDLMRAKRTAEMIILEKKLAVQTSQALRERSFGRYDGKSGLEIGKIVHEELEMLNRLSEEQARELRSRSGIETNDRLMGRFINFLREISVGFTNKNVLIVTHGGVLRTFLIHIGFGDNKALPFNSIENTAVVKLLSDGVDFIVERTEGVNKVG
jgi:broad specificity phosphatase PhoE